MIGFRVACSPVVVAELEASRASRKEEPKETREPNAEAGEKPVRPPSKSAPPEQRVAPVGANAHGLREVRRFESEVGVRHLGFTEGGQRFLSSGSPRRAVGGYDLICVWDKEKEAKPVNSVKIRKDPSHVAFSPTGEYAFVVYDSRYFSLWNLGTGKPHYSLDNDRLGFGDVRSAQFIPNPAGLGLFLVEYDLLRGFDAMARTPVRKIQPTLGSSIPPTWCLCGAISADGKYAVSGGDGVIYLFDWQKPPRPGAEFTGAEMMTPLTNTGRVTEIALSSDAERAVSRGSRAEIRFWDLKDRREFSPFPKPLVAPAFALSRDGRQMLTAEGIGDLTLWDINAGQSIGQAKATVEVRGSVWPHVVFSPDGRFALSSENQTIRLWSMPDR
jgi:WD40 repeat protein